MVPLFVEWMKTAPEAVYLYIPLMKELGLSWTEIKNSTKKELEGLLFGLSQYNTLHQFDGYDEKDINQMSKEKPQIRSDYYNYINVKREYDDRMGKTKKQQSLEEIIS